MAAQGARDISVRGLRKSFGSVEVLHGIDLEIPSGGFIGLMGPNGAGKSTLIKILDGLYDRSDGEITYGGKQVRSLAESPEVGFLHQDLGLIDDLSIVDNLRLGEPPMRMLGPILARNRERAAAMGALERVQLDRQVDELVGQLSPGEKTLVAIARLLDRGARVLFVDEATSTLPPPDAKRLIETLRLLIAEEGATVVMVSHKLSELLDAASHIVVLLDGVVAAEVEQVESEREELVSLLVSHEMEESSTHVVQRQADKAVMRLIDVFGGSAGPVNLVLNAGETVGLTGLAGSGLHDVAYLVNGSMRLTGGKIERDGARTALLPPHRETEGGFNDLSVLDNLTISSLGTWNAGGGVLRQGALQRDAEAAVKSLDVTPPNASATFGTLSGGNKQKVIFGRALLRNPDVYVLCEPTRGVDLATRAAIYRLIQGLAEKGAAVLIVTSDSEDLFAVCDRFAVVTEGQLGDFIWADETNPQELEAFI